ncbi:MAG: PH domain-containing protein [Phycisphaerales bacterium JB039]
MSDVATHWADAPIRRLDPAWITAERISGAIGVAVVTTGALVALLLAVDDHLLWWLAGWLAAAIAIGALSMVAPVLQYRRASYAVCDLGIEIRRGVLWRRITIVPRSRIQHTDVEQGPIMRRFGLAKLVIHTAGAEHATVPLYGLTMADAVAIRDQLIAQNGAGARDDSDGV